MCVETLGSLGPRGLNLIKMIGNKLKQATGEPRSTFFFKKLMGIHSITIKGYRLGVVKR